MFLNCDYLSASTPTTDRHYVGSFGFFAGPEGRHGGHGGTEAEEALLGIEPISTIQRVFGSAASPPGKTAGADPAGCPRGRPARPRGRSSRAA